MFWALLVAACVEIKIYAGRVLNHRVVLHAIDATPARRRGGANSSPLDRARTAASSPPDALVDFHTGRGDALRGHGLVLPSGGRVHLFASAVHTLRRALRHPGLLSPGP